MRWMVVIEEDGAITLIVVLRHVLPWRSGYCFVIAYRRRRITRFWNMDVRNAVSKGA